MLNNRSSTLSLLATRRSGRPRELVGPGPSAAEMEQILTVAARTPDHGKLFPWRFVTVRDDQRDELALLLHQALAAEDETAPAAKYQKADEFARYAGQLVVLISAPMENHKIAVWLTGWQAYSEVVRRAFCAPGERIAGFMFIGHPGRELEERPRAPLATVWRPWQPDS
jgi:nitroreductase